MQDSSRTEAKRFQVIQTKVVNSSQLVLTAPKQKRMICAGSEADSNEENRMLGFLLLAGLGVVLAVLTVRAGFSAKRLLLDWVVILLGAVILGLPGSFLYIGAGVVAATGSGAAGAAELSVVVLVTGILAGAFGGLYLVERFHQKTRVTKQKALGSIVGLCISLAVGVMGLVQAQNDKVFELPVMILVVLVVDMGIIAGYAAC
jgi:hypothetical protein